MNHWKSKSWVWLCVVLVALLTSCYHKTAPRRGAMVLYNEHQQDSLSFQATHHYTNNFNFIVDKDSLELMRQQPEEILSGLPVDTLKVYKNNHLVVADIRIIKPDSLVAGDSVWVQLARDQDTFGWIQESKLLPSVVPDDPISQFINTFSNVHLLIFLVIIILISVVYLMRKLMRQNANIVHFRDISSFYPTLLCVIVAMSATFYASIQMFAPETWRHFYFHPTLNPFSVPLILEIFLISVWAMLIVGLAAVDDVRHELPLADGVMYLCGLAAVCAVNYIVFSISTLYYVGYLLLIGYIIFALRQYFRNSRVVYQCGNCGSTLRQKGKCPYCGVIND
ncbi:zinc ribbon domain-containing protein [Prevotella sp.]|uniref:zinc ribbon domain-containing protein n=1 Tax=Prevotella sp. TaxID=59823 RepID=UPI002F956D18